MSKIPNNIHIIYGLSPTFGWDEYTHFVSEVGKTMTRPKADVFNARGVLAIRLKRSYFAIRKLAQKSLIVGPKETYVRDAKEHHRQTLETKTKRVSVTIADTASSHDIFVHDAAS